VSQPTPTARDASGRRAPRVARPVPPRPLIRWDLTLFVVLAAAAGTTAVALGVAGAGLSLLSDACSTEDCNDSMLAVAVLTAILAPLLVIIAATIVGVVRIRRRRVSFWVPLAGGVLAVAIWLAAAAVAASSVPGQSLFN